MDDDIDSSLPYTASTNSYSELENPPISSLSIIVFLRSSLCFKFTILITLGVVTFMGGLYIFRIFSLDNIVFVEVFVEELVS